jgi:hypothetical protein
VREQVLFPFIQMPFANFQPALIEALHRFGRDSMDFARIMKSIEVIRLIVDGENCVAIVNIDTESYRRCAA